MLFGLCTFIVKFKVNRWMILMILFAPSTYYTYNAEEFLCSTALCNLDWPLGVLYLTYNIKFVISLLSNICNTREVDELHIVWIYLFNRYCRDLHCLSIASLLFDMVACFVVAFMLLLIDFILCKWVLPTEAQILNFK